MNPSLPGATIAAMLTRWAVGLAAGFLVGHHVISDDQVPAFLQDGIAVIPAGAVLLWSYRDKVTARLKQIAAALTGNHNPDISDPALKAKAVQVAKLAAVLLFLVPGIGLTGCASQVAALETALTPYQQAIQAACADVLPLAQGIAADMAASLVPAVGIVRSGVIGGCQTLDGIIAMSKSLTTLPWLGTAKTVLQTKGAVLPPPVAPVPVS